MISKKTFILMISSYYLWHKKILICLYVRQFVFWCTSGENVWGVEMQKEEDIHANYFVHSSMDFFVVLWFQTPMKNLDCFCKCFIILLLIVSVHIHILYGSFNPLMSEVVKLGRGEKISSHVLKSHLAFNTKQYLTIL